MLPTYEVKIACSVKLKENMMPKHGCVLATDKVVDNPYNVDILLCVTPIGISNSERDYVGVSLP